MALEINRKWCKGCGICVEFCPKKILALDEQGKIYVTDPKACIACSLCELRCPDFAIVVKKDSRGEAEKHG